MPLRPPLPVDDVGQGLGQHRTEDDNVGCDDVPPDAAVSATTVEDQLDAPVDLGLDPLGLRGQKGRAAMKRQHQLVAVGDHAVQELAERGNRMPLMGLGVLHPPEHEQERAMRQCIQERLSAGKTPVERSDAYTSLGRDCRHRNVVPLAQHRRRRRREDPLLIR